MMTRRISVVLKILTLASASAVLFVWTRLLWTNTKTTNDSHSDFIKKQVLSRPPSQASIETLWKSKDSTKSLPRAPAYNESDPGWVPSEGFVDPTSLATSSTVPFYVTLVIKLPTDDQHFGERFKANVRTCLTSLTR